MKFSLKENKHRFLMLFTDVYFLLVLLISLILFIYKFQYLSLPYFSDELWVYGPSARKMGLYGPSLLPSSLNLTDHWGHPMMFFCLSGIWGKVFGVSLFSTHLFASTVSITLLYVIYFVCKSLFSRQIGFYTVLIFSSLSIYQGQFSLVLPEVLLTLFTILTFSSFLKGKNISYIIYGSCLVLTKETGVVAIGAIIIWALIKDIFYSRDVLFSKKTFIQYIVLSIPILILCLHFLLLKISYGWFLLPERMEAFQFNWSAYQERLMHLMHYVFIDQGKKPIIIGLSIVVILFQKKYPIWLRAVIYLVAFSIIKIFFKYWKLPEMFSAIVIPIIFIFLLKLLFFDEYKENKKKGSVIALFSIFIFFYLIFSASQFDSKRYVLSLMPFFIIILLYFISKIGAIKKFVLPVFSGIILFSTFYYAHNDNSVGDDNNNYSKMCQIRLESVKFLEDNYSYDFPIKAPFLYRHSIERPLVGYLQSNEYFKDVEPLDKNSIDCKECILIFESKDPSQYYNKINNNNKFKLIHRAENGSVWIDIYIKN